ncbi:MAG: hypothetical protein ABW185_18025 [Sedimenticola sp.]
MNGENPGWQINGYPDSAYAEPKHVLGEQPAAHAQPQPCSTACNYQLRQTPSGVCVTPNVWSPVMHDDLCETPEGPITHHWQAHGMAPLITYNFHARNHRTAIPHPSTARNNPPAIIRPQ